MSWRASDDRLLALVGMPGAGKSTVGRALAARVGWRFCDLDDDIAAEAGASVADIFATEGEPGFRRREAAALAAALARPATVLAVGGGALGYGDNLARLLAATTLVALTAPLPTLAARLAADVTPRPLLAGGELPARLEALWAVRARLYALAHHSVDAAGDVDSVVAALLLIGGDT